MTRCCSFFRSHQADAATAREQGFEGIDEMISGYAKITHLALPPGAALVLASLRKNIATLETLLDDATLAEARPWRLPLPEEQDEWAKGYPKGGILLRRQMCMASLGDEEWFLGGLFISDIGIAFDTGSSPDGRVETGFVPWNDISGLTRPGPENELVLSVAGRPSFSELHLQLTISSDVEWIEGFVRLIGGEVADEVDTSKISEEAPATNEVAQVPPEEEAPKLLLTQLSRSASMVLKAAPLVPDQVAPRGDSPRAHRALSLDSRLSGAYAEAPGGRQAFHVPQGEAPLGSEKLPAADIAAIHAKLQSENWLSKFLKEHKQARDISATPWAESKRAPGVMVRKATLVLPVPQDFPRAVTRLVNLPMETKVTAVFRLFKEADDLVFTVQMCSHDIPYGDNFRVHETAVFKPAGNDVEATTWVEVMWIAQLPWTHGILKSIIEQKTKADPMTRRIIGTIKSE
mmetsp:Transcript_3705/g.13699  ORF Transcript_3705/g.13699 Transcript_3705/m.13699 type:complete len:461 (-) Transcript_3705:483-1865(-)